MKERNNDFLIQDDLLEVYLGCDTEVVIPDGVQIVARAAFADHKNLKSVKIPEGVMKIEQFAFANCTLRNLLIPQSVTDIELNAFIGCGSLEHIAVEEGNLRYDSRNGCNAIVETGTNILLRGCKNTLIPKDINEIDAMAFDNCEGLIEIIIPHSVKKIGEFAFAGCNGLKEVIIPEGVEFINYCCFSGCEKLANLVLPGCLTFIGDNAFGGCDNLTINCHAGSYAEKYAKEQGIKYVLVDEMD